MHIIAGHAPARFPLTADRSIRPGQRLLCDACERAVPAEGCSRYNRYTLCAACTREFTLAWANGRSVTPGQYVRDKRFGEGEAYAIGH